MSDIFCGLGWGPSGLACLWGVVAFFASAGPSQSQTDTIDFLMDWRPQAEQGGFYQAAQTGLYDAAGLNVKLRAGGPQTDPARMLAAGAVDAAMISNAFQALNLIALDADVVIVMAAFQKDPQILMAHAQSGAKTLQDLRGKPLFIGDATVGTFWQWLKATQGYQDRQIRKYNYSLAPWMISQSAAQQGYVTSEPFTAQQAGAEPTVFLLADNGYKGYAAMVGVTRDLVTENPKAVAAFVAANQRGWYDYLYGDPSAANARILRDNKEMTPQLLAHARRAMINYALVGDAAAGPAAVGQMQRARWASLLDEVAALGLYDADLNIEKGITARFLMPAP
ncbi:MAG: ABC transporter substrate-binding protein [Pseudomonadota bacterium]